MNDDERRLRLPSKLRALCADAPAIAAAHIETALAATDGHRGKAAILLAKAGLLPDGTSGLKYAYFNLWRCVTLLPGLRERIDSRWGVAHTSTRGGRIAAGLRKKKA